MSYYTTTTTTTAAAAAAAAGAPNAHALPSLSDVLPADILNSGRFSQFAPYSANPVPGKHDDDSWYYNSPSPPSSSSSAYSPVYDPPSPWSHGERTPSLSPSPPPLRAELPQQQPVELVWMPANIDVATAAAAAAAASTTQPRRGIVSECHPKHAHGVAYIPPGRTHPDVYLGHAAAAHVARIVQLPPQQRGSLRFFRYAQPSL